MNTKIKRLSVINYYGSKSRYLDWLLPFIPEHKSYLEPFVGGASFFLNKPPSLIETISDIDGRLINLFRTLRERPEELIPLLELTLYSRSEFELAHDMSENSLEDARRFFVRALQSFGGITNNKSRNSSFRVDIKESRRNIAASVSKWNSKIEGLWEVIERFRMAQIDNRSAFYLIPKFNYYDVFMYLDPPYDFDSRKSKGDYKHEFTKEQHYELAKLANESKSKILLSHNESDFYDELYPASKWKKVIGPQRLSNLGKGVIKKEVVYINYFNELI